MKAEHDCAGRKLSNMKENKNSDIDWFSHRKSSGTCPAILVPQNDSCYGEEPMRSSCVPRPVLSMLGLLSVLSAGCMNLPEASSGQIGCPASEITISDERMSGLTGTWTAACRGQVFYCSSAQNGEGSAQYQCAPALPSTPVVARRPPSPTRPAAPKEPKKDFPEKALGFQFSSPPAANQAACSSQGHEWSGSESTFACSGAAVDPGLPIKTQLTFHSDGLTEVRAFVTLTPGPGGSQQLRELRKALIAQYGSPDSEQSNIPKPCKEALMACLVEGTASWTSTWEWSDGSIIRARAGGDGEAAIVGILYRLDHDAKDIQEATERLNPSAF
jgi:hypothetical protein